MGKQRYYEYRHVVSVDETNLVGNVYQANYMRWLGRCREMFLREHGPVVLGKLRGDLELSPIEPESGNLAEISPLDIISVRMRLDRTTSTRIDFAFDCVRIREGEEALVGQSRQRAHVRGVRSAGTPARV